MAEVILNNIYIIADNYYKGYRSATYLKDKFIPAFNEINKQKIILTKEQLRKLESHLCTGKSRSLLSDSLYNFTDILSLITENQLLSEKFVIRIIDIIKLFMDKNPHLNTKYNFTWILNLKKNKFKFSEDILKLLEAIGFKNDVKIGDNIDNTELEFIKLLTSKKDASMIITDLIKNFLEKNPQFVPKHEHLKCFVENVHMNYVNLTFFESNQIKDLIMIYDLFKKNNYLMTSSDLFLFLDVIKKYFLGMFTSYKTANSFLPIVVNLSLTSFIKKAQDNDIYINQEMINSFLNWKIKVNYYHEFTLKYVSFLNSFKEIMTIFIKQSKKNNTPIEKQNYIDKLSINHQIFVQELQDSALDLLNFLHENSLLIITDDTVRKIIFNKDNISLNFIIDNNLVSLNEDMMNYACYAGNIDLVKKMINNKYVGTIKNVHYLRLTQNKTISLEILNVLINLGGLPVSDELIEYLISKDYKIEDREKYGLDNDEMKDKIINLSIKYNKFPYGDIKCDFQEKIKAIHLSSDIPDLELILPNLNEQEKIGLFNHLIRIGNINMVIYMSKHYPELCVKVNKRDIQRSEFYDIYLDIFKDLKIN